MVKPRIGGHSCGQGRSTITNTVGSALRKQYLFPKLNNELFSPVVDRNKFLSTIANKFQAKLKRNKMVGMKYIFVLNTPHQFI